METLLRRLRCIGLLLIVPLIALIGIRDLTEKKGPLWLSPNLDPSYVYFLNSLLILHGQPPAHIDHPGTPVQLIGAAVLRSKHPEPVKKITLNALKNPESYLNEIHHTLRNMIVVALFAAGGLLAWKLNSIPAGILCQATPFLFVDSWMAAIRVTPETLFPFIAILYFAFLIVAGERKLAAKTTWPWALLAGLFAGLGVANKLTFLPLLAFLPAIVPGLRNSLVSSGSFFLALAASLFPIWQKLSVFWTWTAGLATHTGRHGFGETGIINPHTYGTNFVTTFADAAPLAPIVVLSVIVAVCCLRHNQTDLPARERAWLLLKIVICQILGVAFVAKHPGRVYTTPLLFSASLNAWHVWVIVFKNLNFKWLRAATAAFAVCVLVFAAWEFSVAQRVFAQRTQMELADARRITDEAGGRPIIRYYSSSSPEYALQLANKYSGTYFAGRLEATYPGSMCWDFFVGGFETVGNTAVPPPDLSKGPVYLTGTQPLENYTVKHDSLVPEGTQLILLWESRYDEPHHLMAQRPTYLYRLELTAPKTPAPATNPQ